MLFYLSVKKVNIWHGEASCTALCGLHVALPLCYSSLDPMMPTMTAENPMVVTASMVLPVEAPMALTFTHLAHL